MTVNGTVAPGKSAGALTANEWTWAAGGAYDFEVGNYAGTTPGVDWDKITYTALNVTAATTPAVQQFTVRVIGDVTGRPNGTYTWLIAASSNGTPVANFDPNQFVLDSTSLLGYQASDSPVIGTSGGGDLSVTYTAAPEPGSAAVLAAASAGLLLRRRRRCRGVGGGRRR